MNIQEFVSLSVPDRYDFSNDGANTAYNKLDNTKNDLEKFFVYMAVAKAYEQEEDNIMKYGADYSSKCKKLFKNIPDPDSESELLQQIYYLLWDNSNLVYCRNGNIIKGETMNSQNTTLNCLYEFIETIHQKEEREMIKTGRGVQPISIRYILSRYIEDIQGQSELFNRIQGMRFFVSIYHTLGNFIPVPVGCNAPRGNGKLKDYWDLTLKIIYDYYMCGIDNIKNIVGESNSKIYKQWLDSFKTFDSEIISWECFVEKNFLQDFVNYNHVEKNYGMPKELWKGHFSGEVLPNSIEQIEQFYVNASSFIIARSIRMLAKIQQKIV